MLISGAKTRRASAIVHRCSSSDGSGASAIAVPALGAKILDDDLLEMIVARVQRAQREQGFDALAPRLPDPDQDAAGERYAELTGHADGLQPHLRELVRAAMVGSAARAQALRHRLQHQPGGHGDRAQSLQVGAAHHARIDVGQQSGRLVHPLRDLGEIRDGRVVTERRQRLARDPVAALRLVAEREQRFVAAGPGAGLGDGDGLVDGEIRRAEVTRRLGERAVAADVAAEPRQRNEHLGRVADQDGMAEVPPRARRRQQSVQIVAVAKGQCLLVRDRSAGGGTGDDGGGARGHALIGACARPLLVVCRCRRIGTEAARTGRRVSRRPARAGVQPISGAGTSSRKEGRC